MIRPVCHQRFLHETNTSGSRNRCPDLADDCAAQRRTQSFPSGGYAHAPFFVASSQIDVKQLVLQTIFLAVLLAVIVNLGRAGKRMKETNHVYEVRPRKDHRGVDLISDALPFGSVLRRAKPNQLRKVLQPLTSPL